MRGANCMRLHILVPPLSRNHAIGAACLSLGFDLRHVFNDVVSDVFYAGSAMRGEILELERRRFWGDEVKLEIVTSVGVGRAT